MCTFKTIKFTYTEDCVMRDRITQPPRTKLSKPPVVFGADNYLYDFMSGYITHNNRIRKSSYSHNYKYLFSLCVYICFIYSVYTVLAYINVYTHV